MTVSKTMSYRSSTFRNSYTTSQSTYKPYRSTYSTDYTSRNIGTTGTSSLYKSSTFISPPSRSPSYTSNSRTLPTIGRSTNTVSYDRGSTSRTLPLRATSTQSYETSRNNYALYTKRDSDRFSTVKSGTANYSSSLSEPSSRSTRNDNANRETDSVNTRHGSNGNDRAAVKHLGGNPEDSLQDSDSEPKSDNHHARRSPSMDRVSREMSTMARAKRYQSVDRIGAAQLSSVGSLNANTDRGRTGLRNLGNTCFMNSVLQCLSNSLPLLEFCLSPSEYEKEINHETSRMKGDLFVSFARLIQSMWNGQDYVSPTDFKSEVSRFARRFGGYNQQDAQEFLISLLEGLQDDLNRVRDRNKKRHIDCSTEVETISASEKARDSWKKYLAYENSKIVDVFVGQLKSALTCLTCGYVSNTFDPFLDLSLPIPKGRSMSSVSLQDCFELFTQEETLEGDERPTCARCRKRQKCTKRLSIQKFPQILIIHLKRFSQDFAYRSKLSTEVKCVTKSLDLRKFSAEKAAGSVVYDLYAVSNHSGTPSGGHYTAAAKNPYTGQWHYFNDQRVSSTSESSVVTSEAYILFYELSSSSSG